MRHHLEIRAQEEEDWGVSSPHLPTTHATLPPYLATVLAYRDLSCPADPHPWLLAPGATLRPGFGSLYILAIHCILALNFCVLVFFFVNLAYDS